MKLYRSASSRCVRRALAFTLALGGAVVALAGRGEACDLCAIYAATELSQGRTGWRAGVGQQFTRFRTLQRDGEEVDTGEKERMNSSITQFVLGYNFTRRLGVQVNVPLIVRDFHRVVDDELVHGDESGFGDLSLIAHLIAFSRSGEDSVVLLTPFAGLKLPSGDSRRLGGEGAHGHGDPSDGHDTHADTEHDHGDEGVPSGIHGHDLALGSGSVDGVLGTRLFASWKQLFFSASVQYLLRTEGDFDYRHANDFLWYGGPGAFVLTGSDLLAEVYSLRLQAALSGETKGKDTVDGAKVNDTGITALYLGPAVGFSWGTSLDLEIGADLPLLINNTGLQVVPDFRLRGGVLWRF